MSAKKISCRVPFRLAEIRGVGNPSPLRWEEFAVVYPANCPVPQIFRINNHTDGKGKPLPSELIPEGELRDFVLAAYQQEEAWRREQRKKVRAKKAQVTNFLRRVDTFVKIAGGGAGPFGGSPPFFSSSGGTLCFLEFPLTGGNEDEKKGGWQLYTAGPKRFTVAVNSAAQVVAYVAADIFG